MRLLYLTFYFDPDTGPGAFRNTSLVDELSHQLTSNDHIDVITTQPNRYQSFQPTASGHEERRSDGYLVTIERIAIPRHKGGQIGQIWAFWTYFRAVLRLTKNRKYDLVVASSSRLFTAFLASLIAQRKQVPLFLDVRDLFRESILDVHKNPLLRLILNPILSLVEQYTFGYARHINLVSEGFRSYFNAFPQATYSFFTNAIDGVFLTIPASVSNPNSYCKIVLYAGNIGEGQGLHKIIPQAARQLGEEYHFVVIGEGSAYKKLHEAIRLENVINVEVRPRVSRQELITAYQQADYLLAHLNDLEAFKRPLPSKLFEYGATDKPILAGVAGYAASFVREHLDNSLVFAPGDVTDLVNQLRKTPYRTQLRTNFREQFQRQTISQAMARQILQTVTVSIEKPGVNELKPIEMSTL